MKIPGIRYASGEVSPVFHMRAKEKTTITSVAAATVRNMVFENSFFFFLRLRMVPPLNLYIMLALEVLIDTIVSAF